MSKGKRRHRTGNRLLAGLSVSNPYSGAATLCPVDTKTSFASRGKAQQFATLSKYIENQRAYKCPHCEYYHLTTGSGIQHRQNTNGEWARREFMSAGLSLVSASKNHSLSLGRVEALAQAVIDAERTLRLLDSDWKGDVDFIREELREMLLATRGTHSAAMTRVADELVPLGMMLETWSWVSCCRDRFLASAGVAAYTGETEGFATASAAYASVVRSHALALGADGGGFMLAEFALVSDSTADMIEDSEFADASGAIVDALLALEEEALAWGTVSA